jgi:hypothetical protein
MTSQARGEGHERPEQLEADIDRTRSAIAQDLRELGEKFSPEHLKEGIKETARAAGETAKELASAGVHHVGERVSRASHEARDWARDQSGPLSLVGMGLGWMAVNSRRGSLLQSDRAAEWAGVALIAGIALGFWLPQSSTEQRLAERTRGRARSEVHEVVREGRATLERLGEGAREAMTAARETVGQRGEPRSGA